MQDFVDKYWKHLIITALLVMSIFSCGTYSNMVQHEEGIQAAKEQTKNVHTQLVRTLRAEGQVYLEYKDLILTAIEKGMSGRYGEGGVKGAMLWIQEQNPQIDSNIMAKLQRLIEAHYSKFANAQKDLLDRCRAYRIELRSPTGALIAAFFELPKIEIEKVCEIVTSAETERDFKAGELSDVDMFDKNQ